MNVRRYNLAMSRYTAKFALLQGFYWITSCLVYAYAERFLTAFGFSVQHVGFVMATANGIALLMQPLFADLADRPNGPSLRAEICAGAALSILLALLLLLWQNALPVIAVLFCALSTVTLTVQPMLNSVGFYYVDRGDPIDYSLARGIASAVFAGYCYCMGFFAERNGSLLLWTYLLANAGMFLMALVFAPKKQPVRVSEKPTGTAALLKKHPYLVFFLLGTVLTFAAHNFINAYMLSIVTHIGKGTHEMSAAISLAAILEIPAMCGFSLLQKRFRLERMLIFSFVAFLVKHLLMLLPLYFHAGIWAVYLSQSLQLCGYALFIPASSFFVNDRMDRTDKVKGQMLLTESITISCILGQLFGGYCIAWVGVPQTMLFGCILSGAGLLLLRQGIEKSRKRCA